MSIFNSLGSNYDAFFIRKATLGLVSYGSSRKLREQLVVRFGSQVVYLTYKGRQAISLCIEQLQLPKGSCVAVVGYTCFAVYQAITAAGFTPYYIDIDEDDLNFSPKTLEKHIKDEPLIRAVIVQNTLGLPANVPAISKLCADNRIALIEDLAHSVGLVYSNNQAAGTLGWATALSFGQDKMVDGVSGGAALFRESVTPTITFTGPSVRQKITTRIYPLLSMIIRKTFSFGLGRVILSCSKAIRILPGPMGGDAVPAQTLPSWYCKLAGLSLEALDKTIKHRQKIATVYRQTLSKNIQFKHQDGAIYLRFPILVDEPDSLINYLKAFNIYLADRWYDAPIAPKRFMQKSNYKPGSCPRSEYVSEHIVNLPTHINVNEKQARFIARKVEEWLRF